MKFVGESFEFVHRGTVADPAVARLDAYPLKNPGRRDLQNIVTAASPAGSYKDRRGKPAAA
jgi:hypothetical protein